jgi:hypothetical protein
MADPITERAIFERKYDGMAAKETVSRKKLAEVFWLERAEMADRHNAELLAAGLALFNHFDKASFDGAFAMFRVAYSNATGMEMAA